MSVLVERLEKSFAGARVLRGLDLHVVSGEIVGIVGSNASGKSTLMRLLGGVLRPDSGAIILDGVDMGERPAAAKRLLTAVFQETLFNQMSDPVKALFSYARFYRHGLTVQDVRNALLRFGVNDCDLKKPLYVLSGGTKKKVEFAKCLLCDTSVYLFDEPFAGFDKASREIGCAIMEDLRARGKAILLADHEHISIGLANKVMELREGRLIAKSREEVTRMQVEVEVKGWRTELKEVVAGLPGVTDVGVRVVPLSDEDISSVLKRAGISPGSMPVNVIYTSADQSALEKMLGLSGGTIQHFQPTSNDRLSHVFLTIGLAAQGNEDNLTWLRQVLLTHELEVLNLEVLGR